MRRVRQLVLLLACGLAWCAAPLLAQAAGSVITYPRPESGSSAFVGYYWRLLEAALARTTAEFGPAETAPSATVMNHQRAMDELVAGSIQVYVRALLPPDYADRLDLVPVPLDKGLLGYRVFLIHKDTQARLAKVATPKDLEAFSMGQGATWADVAVLAHANLNVVKSTSYDGLFPMLQSKRFDLFPRGVNEVLAESEKHQASEPDLVIEDSLVLAYPLSFYFMVKKSPEGEQLKKRLLLGLQRMRSDGSFERMYQDFKKTTLTGLKLKGRKVIRIDNPNYANPVYARQDRDAWDSLAAELRK